MATLWASDQQPTPTPTPISDAPWPKRTNKACCNCRRDKIKCDGERPCAACLRRGLSDDKCIDGCLPCRRSRARCDGADPCARCLELGIDCSDEPPSPSMSLDESNNRSSTGSSRSAPTGRAKLACLACRRDNKKCDDNRPCMRCVSRMEECVHVERIPKAVKHRCINCRRENKKCEDNRPCLHCIESNLECEDAPRKGSGGTRVKMACANCRRNKVQCDPERPCRVCVRRGLECTMPSCTCTEGGLEPGSCSFCRSQRSKLNSQMNDSARSEESQTVSSDTPPPSASSNISDYHEVDGFRNPAQARSHTYNHHISSQGQSFSTDIHMSADTFSRVQYVHDYSSEISTTSPNPFDYHSRFVDQERRQDMYFPQHAHQEFPSGETTLTDLGITNPDAGNEAGLDKFMSRNLGMGGLSSAHPKDPSVPSSFIPARYQQPQTPPQTQSRPSYTSSSFMQSASIAAAHAAAGAAHGGSASMSDFNDDGGGVGVGLGTYGYDGPTTFGNPSPSYGPVSMAMPVSVSIPVPTYPQSQNLHSSRPDAAARNAGQMEMHPQLRRSANYLTSDSRTVQR